MALATSRRRLDANAPGSPSDANSSSYHLDYGGDERRTRLKGTHLSVFHLTRVHSRHVRPSPFVGYSLASNQRYCSSPRVSATCFLFSSFTTCVFDAMFTTSIKILSVVNSVRGLLVALQNNLEHLCDSFHCGMSKELLIKDLTWCLVRVDGWDEKNTS